MIACRPEDAWLEPAGQPVPNRVPVVVANAAYLGEKVEYEVRTGGGRSMLVCGPRRDRHAVGTMLDLVIDTADATVWPRDGTGA